MSSNIPDIQNSLNRNFDTALNNLKRYNQAPAFFDLRFAQYAEGQHYTEALERLRIQNSDFRRCSFSAPIIRTNISGSNYINCTFDTAEVQKSTTPVQALKHCARLLRRRSQHLPFALAPAGAKAGYESLFVSILHIIE